MTFATKLGRIRVKSWGRVEIKCIVAFHVFFLHNVNRLVQIQKELLKLDLNYSMWPRVRDIVPTHQMKQEHNSGKSRF